MTIAIHKGNGNGVWCDRRSPLGNPFHLANESQRNTVCDAYQMYFDLVMAGDFCSNAALIAGDRYGLSITQQWQQPDRVAFLAALDRLATTYQAKGAIVLKCWCINTEIRTRLDLMQKKRCHCLSIAGHLLPEVNSFTEQLSLGV